jgi:hypothetical protein
MAMIKHVCAYGVTFVIFLAFGMVCPGMGEPVLFQDRPLTPNY